MASEVDIVNLGLTLLGEARISSLDDPVKQAREAKAIYEMTRDALLAGYNWCFAFGREQLPALADAPPFGFDRQFQLPSDCLRVVMVGDVYVGVDLTDYRGAPAEEYTIEERKILTDWAAPLNLKYVKRVSNTALFQSNFAKAFGAQLAMDLCEALTQSDTKRDRAEKAFNREISLAVRANAIQLPPQKFPDDEWLLARR